MDQECQSQCVPWELLPRTVVKERDASFPMFSLIRKHDQSMNCLCKAWPIITRLKGVHGLSHTTMTRSRVAMMSFKGSLSENEGKNNLVVRLISNVILPFAIKYTVSEEQPVPL